MPTFLRFIGSVNVLGAVMLVACMNEHFADLLLRKYTNTIPDDKPYKHSEYGRIWLWWAAIGSGFFGVVDLIAAGWPAPYIRVIAWGNVYCYFAFEALAIGASLNYRKWGRGIWLNHFLWIGQGGWGLYTLLRT